MSQAMANSFREWNRMLIEQQQWDVEHEKIQADKENAHMLNVERAKDMAVQREQAQLNIQAQRQQNIINSLKVKGVEEYMKPRPVNIYDYLPMGFHNDKEQLNAAKQVFTDLDPNVGFSLGDGRVVDDSGAPIMMDGATLESKIPFLADIRRGFVDGPTQWKSTYEELMPKYQAAQKQYKDARKKHPAESQHARSAAWSEMQQLKPVLDELQGKMNDIPGHYDNQAAYFDGRAAWAASQHMDDAEKFFRTRANDFRGRRDAYEKNSVKGQIKYKAIYDTNPNSPTYGHAIDFFKGHLIDLPELSGNRSYEKPPALKGSGEKEDSIKPDQVLDNIDKQYQMTSKGQLIPDPLLEEKANTHKSIFRQMILMKNEDGTRQFSNIQADQEAQRFMQQSDKQYWNNILDYRGKNDKEVLNKANEWHTWGSDRYKNAKGYNKMSKDDRQYNRQIGQLFKMWNAETQFNKKVTPSNVRRLMQDWELYRWKHEVALATGLPWDTVYTPSKYTKSKQMRMRRLGVKIHEKELAKDEKE
jgi:hypothetical protein